jgi:predicted nucleic acid-binding protein
VIAPDSSVVVASLSEWHPLYQASQAALLGGDRRLIGHVAFECVGTISRMPEPYRAGPTVVLEALGNDYPSTWLALDADGQRRALWAAVRRGVYGGALYDALIAATAHEHGATLLSADRRALPAYEAVGVDVAFVEP